MNKDASDGENKLQNVYAEYEKYTHNLILRQ